MSAASEKQIAEVRRYMTAKNAGGTPVFDRHIGYILSKKDIAKTDFSLGWGNNRPNYVMATSASGRLTMTARGWCDANGLRTLADIFDDRAIRNYVHAKTSLLQTQREDLQREMDKTDALLAKYAAMLPAEVDHDTSADHDNDATEATGHYDEPATPTASEY